MKSRVITGLIIAAVYFACVALAQYIHSIFFDIIVFALAIIAAIEVSRAVAFKHSPPLTIFVCVTLILSFGTYIAFNYLLHAYAAIGFFAVFFLMTLALFIVRFSSKEIELSRIFSTLFVMVYPVGLFGFMLSLSSITGGETQSYKMLIMPVGYLLLTATFTDMFAMFFGIIFKGPKLAPAISPKKTISGAIGGLIGGMSGAALMYLLEELSFLGFRHLTESSWLNITLIFVIGFVGAIFTQLGDLIASYVKRSCEVKDYGHVLPGHGGIMDRVDGTMVCAVFISVLFTVLSSAGILSLT